MGNVINDHGVRPILEALEPRLLLDGAGYAVLAFDDGCLGRCDIRVNGNGRRP
jgi:hypothetical protein